MATVHFIYGRQESLLICLGSLVDGHVSGAWLRERRLFCFGCRSNPASVPDDTTELIFSILSSEVKESWLEDFVTALVK